MKSIVVFLMLVGSCFGMSEQGFENWEYNNNSKACYTNLGWLANNALCRGGNDGYNPGAPGSTNKAIWLTWKTFFNSSEASCIISPVVTNYAGIVNMKFWMTQNTVWENKGVNVYWTYSLDPSTNFSDTATWNFVSSNNASTVWTEYQASFTSSVFRIGMSKYGTSSIIGIDRIEIVQPYMFQNFEAWPIGQQTFDGWCIGGGSDIYLFSGNKYWHCGWSIATEDGFLETPEFQEGVGSYSYARKAGGAYATQFHVLVSNSISWHTVNVVTGVSQTLVTNTVSINTYDKTRIRLLIPGSLGTKQNMYVDDVALTTPPATATVSSASCSGLFQGELYPVGTAQASATVTTQGTAVSESWLYFKTNGVTSSNQASLSGSTLSGVFTPASRMNSNEYWFTASYLMDEWGNTTTVSSAHGSYVTPPVYPKQNVSHLLEW